MEIFDSVRDQAIREKYLPFDKSNIAATYPRREARRSETEQPRTFHLHEAEGEPKSKTFILKRHEGQEPEGKMVVLKWEEEKEVNHWSQKT